MWWVLASSATRTKKLLVNLFWIHFLCFFYTCNQFQFFEDYKNELQILQARKVKNTRKFFVLFQSNRRWQTIQFAIKLKDTPPPSPKLYGMCFITFSLHILYKWYRRVGCADYLVLRAWSGFSQGWLSNWSVKNRFPVEDLLSNKDKKWK